MRIITSAFVACLAAAALGQAKLTVTRNGKVIGRITVTSKITEDGAKIDEMSMSRTENGKTVDLRIVSNFAADGKPTRKFMAMSLAGTTERHQVVATFTGEGVHVQVLPSSATSGRDVATPQGSETRQGDEFWFIRDRPKVGMTLSSSVFDLSSGAWAPRKVTYLGETELTVAGKRVRAYKVRSSIGPVSVLQYLDSRGLPLRLEQGGLIFERINP